MSGVGSRPASRVGGPSGGIGGSKPTTPGKARTPGSRPSTDARHRSVDKEVQVEIKDPIPLPPFFTDVLYLEDEDTPHEVYFPMELSNADYSYRLVQTVANALRQVYTAIFEQNLAPPVRDGPTALQCEEIEEQRMFQHALSDRASAVYAELIHLGLEGFQICLKQLLLARMRMNRNPSPLLFTNDTMRKLFDAALRIVGAAASAGYGHFLYKNLSALCRQWTDSLTHRRERFSIHLSETVINALEAEAERIDSGIRIPDMEANGENGAIRITAGTPFKLGLSAAAQQKPSTPAKKFRKKAKKSGAGDSGDEESDEEAEARALRWEWTLREVETWEQKVNSLPDIGPVNDLKDPVLEALKQTVQDRYMVLDEMQDTREEEARTVKLRNYAQAAELRAKVDEELWPKAREFGESVREAWMAVMPSEFLKTGIRLEGELNSQAHEAGQDRKYDMADTLAQAKSVVSELKSTLEHRRKVGEDMEEWGERRGVIGALKGTIERLTIKSQRLKNLEEDITPPVELMQQATVLEQKIGRMTKQWADKDREREDRRRARGTNGSQGKAEAKETDLFTQEREHIASLKARLKQVIGRLQWREMICEFVRVVVSARGDAANKIVMNKLQLLLEPNFFAASIEIADLIMKDGLSTAKLWRLMDNRDQLMETAAEKAELIQELQQRRRNRWKGLNFTEVAGWLGVNFGTWGRGEVEFRDPCGLTIGRDGEILVADRSNHRVQILNSNGRLTKVVGTRGSDEGELECPSDIAIGKMGQICIADRGNNRVSVFMSTGGFLHFVGSGQGSGVGQLQGPCAVSDALSHHPAYLPEMDLEL